MQDSPRKELGLFDSTCLIVGIVVGVGIYQVAPSVAWAAGSPLWLFALWAVGGVLSLCGAFGYAELAAAYPREGGDYVYLSRAFGPRAGFLFGWIQLAVVRPGDIVVVAFAFGLYGQTVFDPLPGSAFPYTRQVFAAAAIVVLTAVHAAGVREGKWTQNVLTVVKVLGLLAVAAVALAAPAPEGGAEPAGPLPASLALILVLFTYGGWNEMAYVAAEVRRPERNIARALLIGTVAVMVVYLLANAAFLRTLGFAGMAASEAVAADTVAAVYPGAGARLVSALVCVSALGAVSGLIFTGARISYAVGADHRAFRLLGLWNRRTGTPVAALVVQAVIALALVVVLGSFVDTILYTAPAVYAFYLATSAAVIVLRRKDPAAPRPFRVPGYPVTTLLFCGACAFLIYSAVVYRPTVAAASLGILLMGVPLYEWVRRRDGERPCPGSGPS